MAKRSKQSRGRHITVAPRNTKVGRARRAARHASSGMGTVITQQLPVYGGAAALALAERPAEKGGAQKQLKTVADIDPGLVYGLSAGLVVPMVLKGKAGRFIARMGLGAACVGLHRSILRGSAKVKESAADADD
jgi:hypothetical protein